MTVNGGREASLKRTDPGGNAVRGPVLKIYALEAYDFFLAAFLAPFFAAFFAGFFAAFFAAIGFSPRCC